MGHFREHQKRVETDGAVSVPVRPPRITPVQRHKLRTAPEGAPPGTDIASRVRQAATGRAAAKGKARSIEQRFDADVESLHGLTIAEKVARKRGFIEAYRGQVEALLAAGVMREKRWTWWIVWLFDVGRIEEFIPRACQAIALGWLTSFSSDLRTFLYDCIYAWAKAEFEAGRGVEPYFGQCYAETADMKEVVAAKYHKLAGDVHLRVADAAGQAPAERKALEAAMACWNQAEAAYGSKAGVKTRIEQHTRRLGKLAAPEPTAPEKPAADAPTAEAPTDRDTD